MRLFNVVTAWLVLAASLLAWAAASPASAQTIGVSTDILTVTVTPSPTSATAIGQVITYTYTIHNNDSGTVPWFRGRTLVFSGDESHQVEDIAVSDNVVSPIDCGGQTVLLSNASMTCTGSHTITAADAANGFVANTVTVTGRWFAGHPQDSSIFDVLVTAQANVPVNLPPATGTLQLVQNTSGGDGTFTFTGTGAAPATTSITTSGGSGQAAAATYLAGNAFTITQAAAAGYVLTGLSCTGGASVVTNAATGEISGSVGADETVVCTYSSARLGSITIRKDAIGGDDTFNFISSNPALPSFNLTTLSGTASQSASNLAPGTYRVQEVMPTGWKLDRIRCTGGTTTTNLAQRTVTITLSLSSNVHCIFTNSEASDRTKRIIGKFMRRRGDLVTANLGGPRLIDRMRKQSPRGPKYNGRLNDRRIRVGGAGDEDNGQLALSTSLSAWNGFNARRGWDLWLSGRLTYFRTDDLGYRSSGRFGQFEVGADYLVSPGILIGAMVHLDHMKDDSLQLGYRVSGSGWMTGPYVEFRLNEHLILDFKGLWGRTANEISPFLTYTDSFKTERWLASARLLGSWHSGKWHFSPRAQIVGYRDRQHAYTDSNDIRISGQAVTLGRLILFPKLSYRHINQDRVLFEPSIGLKGMWTFSQNEIAAISQAGHMLRINEFQLGLEAGLKIETEQGIRIELSAHEQDFLDRDNTATTGRFSLTIPLQKH